MATHESTSRGGGAARGERWALTPDALAGLLDLLGPDRESAAREYERIRAKLLRLFEWRGCPHPEELVDETMNRVAHKAADGLELRTEDPFRYACSVAYLVFKEILRDRKRHEAAVVEMGYTAPEPGPAESDDERMGCLQQCLGELHPQQRDMLLRYHDGDGGARIKNRKRLADDLGVPMNALRIRAHRLRVQLEDCVRQCVSVK
jgi:DNA-directed RNA polymerase specialized sigma24 family protein